MISSFLNTPRGKRAYESLILTLISIKGGGACWPLDDAVGATSARDLTTVFPGTIVAPSTGVGAFDQNGKTVTGVVI